MLRYCLLGTGAAHPTPERNASAVYLQIDRSTFLFDCGEGTQRQLQSFGIGFDIDTICISHTDSDHVLGLSGLISTMDFIGRESALTIIGPMESLDYIMSLAHTAENNPSFDIEFVGVDSGGEVVLESDGLTVRSVETDHRDNQSFGYVVDEGMRDGKLDVDRARELGVPDGPLLGELKSGNDVELDNGTVVHSDEVVGEPRKGHKFVYSGDTEPVEKVIEASRGADVLIHDATYAGRLEGKAAETAHTTASQAGEVAAEADVETLVLTHISSRHADEERVLLKDAQNEFDGSVLVGRDGLERSIGY